jgi:CRP-like cAMP-binding protein
MTETMDPGTATQSGPNGENGQNGNGQRSLDTTAARNLATTTKTVPQMQNITSRWLLRMLPWAEVSGGTYRVNRRLSYSVGDGRVTCVVAGGEVDVVAEELRELPVFCGVEDPEVLSAVADRFEQVELSPGEVLAHAGQPADRIFLIAHGKLQRFTTAKYDGDAALDVLADGEFFGHDDVLEPDTTWPATVKAATASIVLALPRQSLEQVLDQFDELRAHVEQYLSSPKQAQNRFGEADIAMASSHEGEPDIPGTFVDYETSPREYQLSVAQTVLRVHTRVADLYNDPMNQLEQQVRLTVQALRERQEWEMINNREFGLLHNADFGQRIRTRTGPPTPDDLDELISRRTKAQYFFAHPRAIAAFGRECTRRGLYPDTTMIGDHAVPAWRGLPLLPCSKIPISDERTTSILVVRTGEDDRGVVGLHQTGIPDEYEPSLSVRFMGIDEKAIMSYLVSAYYSVAILVPDALGVLEDVELGHFSD